MLIYTCTSLTLCNWPVCPKWVHDNSLFIPHLSPIINLEVCVILNPHALILYIWKLQLLYLTLVAPDKLLQLLWLQHKTEFLFCNISTCLDEVFHLTGNITSSLFQSSFVVFHLCESTRGKVCFWSVGHLCIKVYNTEMLTCSFLFSSLWRS